MFSEETKLYEIFRHQDARMQKKTPEDFSEFVSFRLPQYLNMMSTSAKSNAGCWFLLVVCRPLPDAAELSERRASQTGGRRAHAQPIQFRESNSNFAKKATKNCQYRAPSKFLESGGFVFFKTNLKKTSC